MNAMPRLRARPLGPSARRTLLALLAGGLVIRLTWLLQTGGVPFDLASIRMTAAALLDQPLQLYGDINPPNQYRWPYPPGYFPWVLASHGLDSIGLVRMRVGAVLPAVVADLALAWVVQAGLGRIGAAERTRLAAAGLVALGPSFALISGFHGQIDAVAILPAVLALLVWERGGSRRALAAGLLIGFGASIKTAPGLMVLALLPTVASRREALTLISAAVAVPLAALAPFLVADADGVTRALGYGGIPGQGGVTMLANPDLARFWVQGATDIHVNGVVRVLSDNGSLITATALLAAGLVAARRRMEPRQAAVLLWCTFFVVGTAFAFQYAVWLLPFLLLAGRLRWAAALQGALLVPALLYYGGPFKMDWAVPVYIALMAIVWLGFVAALVATLRTRARAASTA